MTFRYLRPDGAGEVWLEQIAFTQFNAAGKPVRIHGLTTDITERKRYEQEISLARKSAELKTYCRSVPGTPMVADPAGVPPQSREYSHRGVGQWRRDHARSAAAYIAEYYQGAEGLQRGGFGLGLAIVRRLANLLDHRVDVSSEVGKGTRFSIEVPRVQTRSIITEVPRSLPNELICQLVAFLSSTTSVRTAVARFLKAKGIKATVTATGGEALTLVNEQNVHPDLVLSDYNLRGSTNGVEHNEVAGCSGWNVPAIVMTGDMRSETLEAIAAQNISVMIKPFSVTELLHHMTQIGPEL